MIIRQVLPPAMLEKAYYFLSDKPTDERGQFYADARLDPVIVDIGRELGRKWLQVEDRHLFMHMPPQARRMMPGEEQALLGMHQDMFYNTHLSGPFSSVWVPLVPIDEKCGGIRSETECYAPMDVGDIVAFEHDMWHASMPNLSNRVRLSCEFRFFDDRLTQSTKHHMNIRTGEIIAPKHDRRRIMSTPHVSLSQDPYVAEARKDRYPADIVARIIEEVRPYSMAPDHAIACTIERTIDAINNLIPGDFVECGTWKGGNSFAMLLTQRYVFGKISRPVWMYDSFQGMSPPSVEDGEHAAWWRRRSLSGRPDPDHQNYCAASVEEVWDGIGHFKFPDMAVHICPGWFDTLATKPKPSRIAVLRIDCDWYDPVKCVFENLAPRVSTNGFIILDDYYAWEGCVLATHEYLAKQRVPWAIRSVPDLCGAWMIKEKETW